jgi:hypothetical protein
MKYPPGLQAPKVIHGEAPRGACTQSITSVILQVHVCLYFFIHIYTYRLLYWSSTRGKSRLLTVPSWDIFTTGSKPESAVQPRLADEGPKVLGQRCRRAAGSDEAAVGHCWDLGIQLWRSRARQGSEPEGAGPVLHEPGSEP